jgi:hypothetical protein
VEQPARNRTPLPVRIAIWRRRVLIGSIGLFVAAWVAVAGLGRQATFNASAGTATTTSDSATQAQTQTFDSQAQQSDPSQPDSSASQDLSSATTSQS